MYQPPPPLQPPRQPSWWSRNWKWVVPVGCLGPLAIFVGVLAFSGYLLYSGFTDAVRSTEPYQDALARAQAHPEVRAALGEPIEAGFWITSDLKASGSTGDVNLAIPISGPKRSGTVHLISTKAAGTWHTSTMEVEIPGQPSRINLLAR
ncbi:MAG: cytochrome c oxidase assembly factor Coa1 family protein [Chloroflexota bacterium]